VRPDELSRLGDSIKRTSFLGLSRNELDLEWKEHGVDGASLLAFFRLVCTEQVMVLVEAVALGRRAFGQRLGLADFPTTALLWFRMWQALSYERAYLPYFEAAPLVVPRSEPIPFARLLAENVDPAYCAAAWRAGLSHDELFAGFAAGCPVEYVAAAR